MQSWRFVEVVDSRWGSCVLCRNVWCVLLSFGLHQVILWLRIRKARIRCTYAVCVRKGLRSFTTVAFTVLRVAQSWVTCVWMHIRKARMGHMYGGTV